MPLLLLHLLSACDDGAPPDTSGETGESETGGPVEGDADGDGWREDGGDCDDADEGINPDAVELPDNGVDEDCDGRDISVPSLAGADVVLRGTAVEGLAGTSVATGGDADGDGSGDLLVGAPGGKADAATTGCAYLFRGPVSSGDVASADAALCGEDQYDTTGQAVVFIGDGDGDGLDDFVVAAPENREVTGQSGAVFLFRGAPSGLLGTSDADATFWGDELGSTVGSSVARIGDVDGDGLADVAFGSRMIYDDGIPGRALIWFGPQDGRTGGADVVLTSDEDLDYAGQSIASAGDVNGDGWTDLLVGAPLSGADGAHTGKVWLAFGPLTSSGALSDSAAAFVGVEAQDYAGISVSSAGDVDGDGKDDLLIGGHLAEEGGPRSGKAWLVLGPDAGTHSLADADARFVGEAEHDLAGYGVVSGVIGGVPSLLVAAIGDPYGGTTNPGTIYLLTADATGFSPASASLLRGEHPFDGAGTSMTLAGDVTGDGVPDLVVGAPGNDASGANRGSVYVLAAGGALLGP